MKLRQKLAVVLASAMVVTAVPVVTMAASDNGMLREVLAVEKNAEFKDTTTAAGLQIRFKDAWQGKTEVFYLELENAEWLQSEMLAAVTTSAATATTPTTGQFRSIEFPSKKVMKVTYQPSADFETKVETLPLLVKATGGDAKVTLSKQGSTSTITDGSWVFATTASKKLTATVDTATSFYTEGKMADIILSETFRDSLTGTEEVAIEIQDGDFEFDFPTSLKSGTQDKTGYTRYDLTSTYFEYTYGLAGHTAGISVYVNKEDKGAAIVKVTGASNKDSIGKIVLKGFPVTATTKTPDEGDLLVDIKNINGGEVLSADVNDAKVANIVKYSTYIKMTDDKAVEIKAGQSKEVEFTIGEYVDDSMVGNRKVEITLDNENAHFVNGSVVLADQKDGNSKHEVVAVDQAGNNVIEFEYVNDKDHSEGIKKIIVTLTENTQVNNQIDWFKLKAKVCVPVDEKDAKEIKIKAEGRALETEVETTAVTIVNPFDVEMEELRVKVGLQGQVGGKVVITETDKAMLNKGTLEFSVINPETKEVVEGITFYNKDNVSFSVEGDMKKADLEQVSTTGAVKIKINRQSKAASTLTLEDFKVTVDRTVPEGKYDLVISGDAIDAHGHTLTVKDFFVVGTPNTEDIAANGLRRGTTTFVIGESKYTANGVSYDMSAASYIQDPGYTMIPVRYVAEAFGVKGTDIIFAKGTATIFAGERTIQLTNNSDVAVVNGASIKMSTKVVIKDGRTYAPVSEIAKILGISSNWDSTTKTATFTNN